jgi:hypothetical protein
MIHPSQDFVDAMVQLASSTGIRCIIMGSRRRSSPSLFALLMRGVVACRGGARSASGHTLITVQHRAYAGGAGGLKAGKRSPQISGGPPGTRDQTQAAWLVSRGLGVARPHPTPLHRPMHCPEPTRECTSRGVRWTLGPAHHGGTTADARP